MSRSKSCGGNTVSYMGVELSICGGRVYFWRQWWQKYPKIKKVNELTMNVVSEATAIFPPSLKKALIVIIMHRPYNIIKERLSNVIPAQISSVLGSHCPCLLQTAVILTSSHLPLWWILQHIHCCSLQCNCVREKLTIWGRGRCVAVSYTSFLLRIKCCLWLWFLIT